MDTALQNSFQVDACGQHFQYFYHSWIHPLCNLSPGEHVWVTDAKTPGTVVQSHSTPRCYAVDLPQGTVRRNRLHLIPLHSPSHEKSDKRQCVSNVPVQVPQTCCVPPVTPVNTDVVRTRSGRAIVKPKMLDL